MPRKGNTMKDTLDGVVLVALSFLIGFVVAAKCYNGYHVEEPVAEAPQQHRKEAVVKAEVSGVDMMERLLTAVEQVESNGDTGAVGDDGRSRGSFQIGKAYWQDACEQLEKEGGGTYEYDGCVGDPAACRAIVKAYWRRYAGDAYESLLGKEAVHEAIVALARTHNGGPKGAAKESTIQYGRKVVQAFNGKGG